MITFSAIGAGICLICAFIQFLWSRTLSIKVDARSQFAKDLQTDVDLLHRKHDAFELDLPESKLVEVEAWIRELKNQFDQLIQENTAHKSQVHRSIQRFDQIMRRNERAASVIEQAQADENGGLDTDPEDDATAEAVPQEGDRSFLAGAHSDYPNAEQAPRSPEDDRMELMRQYYANRGMRVPGVPPR